MRRKARSSETDDHPSLKQSQAGAATLAERFNSVRARSAELCAPLATEDYVVQSMPDVSPAKWHLAHTSWFFETFILKPHRPGYEAFHPRYDYLFNSYYVQVGARHCRPRRGLLSRPTVEDIYRYRAHVDAHMREFLQELKEEEQAEFAGLLELGLNHEQQHQELIVTDIKHVFSCNPLRPAYRQRSAGQTVAVPSTKWISHEGGLREIGHDQEGFAFDNESPRHRVWLPPYRLASRPVTNGEYLEFLADGGYTRADLWLSDGWDQVVRQSWTAPLYWERHANRWFTYTLAGMHEVDEAEPVCHVSYYEADAYARWAGARLPTEQELEVAAGPLAITGNFAENGRLHPLPVKAAPDSALGQIYGDVWEWTRSPYVAYPGFRAAAGAIGEYNGKFMCNQLVLRGGSCATAQTHMRPSYRNFFYPDARWQFAGIRLAQDI
jgi:ergothioneine biosynthesis protein EgtB